MCIEIKTNDGLVEIETQDHYNNEGLENLELRLDTDYGFSLVHLDEKKAKELSDALIEWYTRD